MNSGVDPVLTEGIEEFPLFDVMTCQEIILSLDASELWTPAMSYENGKLVESEFRRCNTIIEEEAPDLLSPLASRLLAALRENGFDPAASGTSLSPIRVAKYYPGQFFKDHRDGTHRKLSLVAYLNDDFIGGATRFREAGIVVTPVQGHAILFRSDLLHCGDPVEEGVKYIVLAWYL